jgi:aspartyl-tRNA(Asn)/glutamyl-tRNA(Gln) amidotransferase subunit C
MNWLEEISKAAALAALDLSPEQKEIQAEQLRRIVDAFASLQDVALTRAHSAEDVEPLYTFSEEALLRDDIAENPLSIEDLMQNAPDSEGDLFRIPQLLGDVS